VALNEKESASRILGCRSKVRNNHDIAVYLEYFRFDLRGLDGSLATVLVGKRVRITFRDIPLIGFADYAVRDALVLKRFRSVDDYVTRFDWTGDGGWNRNEPVSGLHFRLHTAGFHEPEQDRLIENLSKDEKQNENNKYYLKKSYDLRFHWFSVRFYPMNIHQLK
jgi:hypothetical protein